MILKANNLDVDVRTAAPADVPLLLAFIRKMAAFEKLAVSATEESIHNALFGEIPAARALIASIDRKPAGYMTYFFSFSSMMGRRALWLDDLFVDPEFRGKGIGKVLMAYMASIAVKNECARFEWIVLDWNTNAIEFYQGLGANVLADWRICHMDEVEMKRLASTLAASPDGD
jgi:GNAT superfamily N-acetyltransferase